VVLPAQVDPAVQVERAAPADLVALEAQAVVQARADLVVLEAQVAMAAVAVRVVQAVTAAVAAVVAVDLVSTAPVFASILIVLSFISPVHRAAAEAQAIAHLEPVVLVVGLIHLRSIHPQVRLIRQSTIQHLTYMLTTVVQLLVDPLVAVVEAGMVVVQVVTAVVFNRQVPVVIQALHQHMLTIHRVERRIRQSSPVITTITIGMVAVAALVVDKAQQDRPVQRAARVHPAEPVQRGQRVVLDRRVVPGRLVLQDHLEALDQLEHRARKDLLFQATQILST
jgi:hypothetical protein